MLQMMIKAELKPEIYRSIIFPLNVIMTIQYVTRLISADKAYTPVLS